MPRVYLHNYQEFPFELTNVFLDFDLYDEHTIVTNRMNFERKSVGDLVLFGEELNIVNLKINDKTLNQSSYEITNEALIVKDCPEKFTLEVTTNINPKANTSLQGLYRSGEIFCTQCEAEGFRRISYFPDRPDVLSIFTTKITADPKYPVLLSNGNLVEQGVNEEGRKWVVYEDPFKKPSYLFALVAGDLKCVSDTFVTTSFNKTILLNIYAKSATEENCQYALQSLKDAMRFDEEKYDREYDLDTYNIVAVDDFNFGAMENKGLNIFNSQYLLANPKTTTDKEHQDIAATVAHEYFHNWTGNKVTIRDWFQLSIKEGLTVFREHQYVSFFRNDISRIENVNLLRNQQFIEDFSALAHPVRPDSYEKIDNFYTYTVYYKGAEIVRMLNTILGEDGFKQGMDLYFSKYDGKAITIENFLEAMEVANNKDLSQFMLWYTQAGTPEVTVKSDYQDGTLKLHFTQNCALTSKSNTKLPFQIPIKIALFDRDGTRLKINELIELTHKEQSFQFENLTSKPIISLLRDFSAPVILHHEWDNADNLNLLQFETDVFAKCEAAKRLALFFIVQLYETKSHINNQAWSLPNEMQSIYRNILYDNSIDAALRFEILTPPSFEDVIGELQRRGIDIIDVEQVEHIRDLYEDELGFSLLHDLKTVYLQLSSEEDNAINNVAFARRKLKNFCMQLLMKCCPDDHAISRCYSQYNNDYTMTDQLASFASLLSCTNDVIRNDAAETFYRVWERSEQVIDYWFSYQALSHHIDTVEKVRALTEHPAFNIKNPNRVYALLKSFAYNNPRMFHTVDGSGYALISEMILKIDKINPVVSAELARAFTRANFLDNHRKALISHEISNMLSDNISSNLAEILESTFAFLNFAKEEEKTDTVTDDNLASSNNAPELLLNSDTVAHLPQSLDDSIRQEEEKTDTVRNDSVAINSNDAPELLQNPDTVSNLPPAADDVRPDVVQRVKSHTNNFFNSRRENSQEETIVNSSKCCNVM